LDNSVLERLCAVQAAHDACKDARDVAGAEGAQDGDKVAGGTALLQGRREFPAVVDEFSHEGEQAAGAARLGVGLGGRRAEHERDESTERWRASIKITE
jgi:hypothetical protein